MSKPLQFTMKDLFWTVTLIGLGIGGLVFFIHDRRTATLRGIVWGIFWLVSGLASLPMIGAGVYAPFAQNVKGAKRRGAAVVAVAMLILFGVGALVAILSNVR